MTNGYPWGGTQFPQVNWRAGMGNALGEGVIADQTGRAIASATGSDTTVTLRPHRVLIQGVEDDLHTTDIDVSTFGSNPTGSQQRIDQICWKYDPTAKTVTITCVPGSPATSPSPPALTRDPTGVWYAPICTVRRGTGPVLPGNLTPAHAWVGPYYGTFTAVAQLPDDAAQGSAAWVDDQLYRRVWDSGASDMVWRNVNDPPWSSLAGGPGSTGGAFYRVINGGVQLKGNKTYVDIPTSSITNFPTSSFSAVGLLPTGARPAADMHTVCRFLTASYGGGMCDVEADGNVMVKPPAGAAAQTVSLDGIWVPL